MTDNFDDNSGTTPMPRAEQPPVPSAVVEQPVAVAPIPPAEPAPTSSAVSVPKRWLVIGGSALLALVVISGTFAAGVAVGDRSGGRFEGRGELGAVAPGMPGPDGYAPRMREPGDRFGGREGHDQDREHGRGFPQSDSTTTTP